MTAKVTHKSGGKFTRLLVAGDVEPVVVTNSGSRSPYLFVCDHAGRTVPQALGSLGLPADAFDRHIAWDIGAGDLSMMLGEAFGACVIRQNYSRLVIDCNRAPDRSDAIVEVSDGTEVPANMRLEPAAAAARIAEIHAPYHLRIAQELDLRADIGVPTLLVAIHSFTPVMNGFVRPWRLGVLHLGDSPFSLAMLASLGEEGGAWAVGDNQPYAMDGVDHTIPLHAITRGLDYLELEVRQDLIAEPNGRAEVAALLRRRLEAAMRSVETG